MKLSHAAIAAWFSLASPCLLASPASIQKLLDAGDAQQAYEVALAESASASGEPNFDYWFAMAAVASGHPGEAIFPLERVLALDPSLHAARLELAKAYQKVGDAANAQAQLAILKQASIPEDIKKAIRHFDTNVQQQDKLEHSSFWPYASAEIGNDSNANSATQAASVTLPTFGVVTLDATSRQVPATYTEWVAGTSWRHPMSQRRSIYMGVQGKIRANDKARQLDQHAADFSIGGVYANGNHAVRLPFQAQYMALNNITFRRTGSMGLEYMYQWDKKNAYSASLTLSRSIYPRDHSQSVRTRGFVFGWKYVPGKVPFQFDTKAFVNHDTPTVANGLHNLKNSVGLSFESDWYWKPRWTPVFLATYQISNYGREHPLFAVTRKEHQWTGNIALNYRWSPSSVVSFGLNYVSNDSNIVVYHYDRAMFFARWRWVG